MYQKVAFTLYPIRDTERARSFYEGTLGLEVGMTAHGMWTEYDLPGGGCLALYQTEDLEPSTTAGGSVAIEVDDLDALNEELRSKGVKYTSEMIDSPVCRMSIIEDSEGNAVILHEKKKSDT